MTLSIEDDCRRDDSNVEAGRDVYLRATSVDAPDS
jgi:hypothetical protein